MSSNPLGRVISAGESTSTTAKNAKQSTYGAAIRACALQRRNSGWATFALKSLCYHNRSMDANIKLYNQMAFFLTAKTKIPSVPITGNTPNTTAGMCAEGKYQDTEAALYSERIKSRIKPTVPFRIRNVSCIRL